MEKVNLDISKELTSNKKEIAKTSKNMNKFMKDIEKRKTRLNQDSSSSPDKTDLGYSAFENLNMKKKLAYSPEKIT